MNNYIIETKFDKWPQGFALYYIKKRENRYKGAETCFMLSHIDNVARKLMLIVFCPKEITKINVF